MTATVKSSAAPSAAKLIFDAPPVASMLNAIASTVAAVLSAEPRASVPEPFGSMVIVPSVADVIPAA